jgi:pyridoxine/pyridoxamine 5'-phosphate oxidase
MDKNVKISRPYMPGYGIQAAKRDEDYLPWSFVEERMTAARNYWISSTRPDGKPHPAPVWGLWHEGAFVFGTEAKSQKAENLTASPLVAVHLESGDEVVILEGVIEKVEEGDFLNSADEAFLKKYEVGLVGAASVFILRIEKAMAWLESDFPNTATRWTFD